MFLLFASIMVSSLNTKQYSYFWDSIKELSIQCIMDNTVWLNHKKIEKPQKLGKYIEILEITQNGLDIRVYGNLMHLNVGERIRISKKMKLSNQSL